MQGRDDSSDMEPGDRPGTSRLFDLSTGFWIIVIAVVGVCLYLIIFYSTPNYTHTAMDGYVGPLVCGECHEEQYESWSETRMAKSFDALLAGQFVKEKELVGLDPNQDYTRDEYCLPCHTTGYGRFGGFVSVEQTPHMMGVTCEACHGAGGMYVANVMDAADPTFDTRTARSAGLIYPPTARICRGCHNEDSPFVDMGYEFDYEKRVELGTHQHFALKYDHKTELPPKK